MSRTLRQGFDPHRDSVVGFSSRIFHLFSSPICSMEVYMTVTASVAPTENLVWPCLLKNEDNCKSKSKMYF